MTEQDTKNTSRDHVRAAIHWDKIVTIISVVNPLVAIPQIVKLWQDREAAGVSTLFLLLIFLVQAGFSLHGYFLRDRFLTVSNGAAALMTVVVIASVQLVR